MQRRPTYRSVVASIPDLIGVIGACVCAQERERGMVKRSVARSLAALIQVTKFLYHEQSHLGVR